MTCFVQELDINDIKSAPNMVQDNSTDALGYLSSCMTKGALTAFISLLLLNNESQTSMVALSTLLTKAAEEELNLSNAEIAALDQFKKDKLDKFDSYTKDQFDSTANAEFQNAGKEYNQLKTEWDTKIQNVQTSLQSLTQKQQGQGESAKLFIQVAQDITDFISFVSMLLR